MEYFTHITANPPNCIVLPIIEATQFKIHLTTIFMLSSFHGLDWESAYNHLGKFLIIRNTFKNQNISADGIRFRLFPFCLINQSRATTMMMKSNPSWSQLPITWASIRHAHFSSNLYNDMDTIPYAWITFLSHLQLKKTPVTTLANSCK